MLQHCKNLFYLEVCTAAGVSVFKCLCVYLLFEKSPGFRVCPGPLYVCVVFLSQMSLLCLCFQLADRVSHFKPETEQVLHWQYPTAEWVAEAALHLCSIFFTVWKPCELVFAWNVVWRCSLRGHWMMLHKKWCLQLWSRCYYIVVATCSLALILKTWSGGKIFEYMIKTECWFMETCSVGTFKPPTFLPAFPAVMLPG